MAMVNIDEIPSNQDWPKRTPDKIEDISGMIREEPSERGVVRPKGGDRVRGIPFNDDGRYADYIDVFPPDEPEGPIEGYLIQEVVDTFSGPRLSSYIVADDGHSRKVDIDSIVVLESKRDQPAPKQQDARSVEPE